MLLALCTRACHLCTRCVYSLHWVRVSSAHSACPLGTGRCPLSTEVPVTCGRVLVSSAHSASPLCTERTSCLHRARVPPAHGVCQRHAGSRTSIIQDSHRARKSGTECSPTGSCRLLVWVCTQEPPALAPLGAHGGCMVTSNHLCKLSWAFLRGAG